jgi:hypothetical protein
MHRVISITTMAALAATLVLPAMPKSHAGSGTRMVCHRAPVTHTHQCAEMQTMGDAQQEDVPPQTPFYSSNEAGSCPMDCCCCVQANFGKNAALAPLPTSQARVKEQGRVLARSIVFRSRGFSSHTDRGPPSIHA